VSDGDGHLLLVGMMGAGKTTVGRLVADHLGRPYRDSDTMVEEATGHSVPELFATEGEAAFRAAESAALRAAVAPPPAVISVAGGAVLDPANRALLAASGTVVWLRAAPETLAARVGDGDGRPLLAPDPARALVALDAARRPLYAEVADAVVDVDDLAPTQVADAVLLAAGPRP
jgi:shikimate kinase